SANARNRRLPPGVDRVLLRALSKDPAERHQSVWELLEELIQVPDLAEAHAAPPPEQAPPAYVEPASEPVPPPPAGIAVTEPAAPQHVAPTNGQAAPIPADSAVSMLHKMGVPSLESHELPLLNSYFACLMRHAKDVAE